MAPRRQADCWQVEGPAWGEGLQFSQIYSLFFTELNKRVKFGSTWAFF